MRPGLNCSTLVARAFQGALLLGLLCVAHPARAADEVRERAITTDEISSWLEGDGTAPGADKGAKAEDETPPPPPRHKGVVIESTIGAFGHLGSMRYISPTAPWFRVQLGFEPFRFLMLFGEADLVLANTSYGRPPPPPRTYALYGFGGGLRGTLKVLDRVGLYAQASGGGASITEDVLSTYGYQNANQLAFYYGAELGVEWYQVNPHLALAVHGGIRDYPTNFLRVRSNQEPLAWVSGVALRYTF
ncbi:MAG TPA: hypothetical protein VGI10_00250 [Polyangiaceae bacterium]|jgi:hypothetical protein